MGSEGFPMSAEAPPGFAQHVCRCSFAAPHPIERVALQALYKKSLVYGLAQKLAFAQKLQSLHKNYKGLLRPAGRV